MEELFLCMLSLQFMLGELIVKVKNELFGMYVKVKNKLFEMLQLILFAGGICKQNKVDCFTFFNIFFFTNPPFAQTKKKTQRFMELNNS